MRHSILKKSSLYDVIDAKTSTVNALNNISFNNASTTSTSKIVRFTGVDTQETTNNNSHTHHHHHNHSHEEATASQQPTHGSDNKSMKETTSNNQTINNHSTNGKIDNGTPTSNNKDTNDNAEDTFDEVTNELKKYYRKSKAVPFKQINLVGLNGEFLVSSSTNANQIMSTPTHATLQSNGSYMRHQKSSLQRSKSMRVASAQKHQSEFRSNRQNTYPSISSWSII